MRSTLLKRKSAAAALSLRSTGIDRELFGLCLILALVVCGHLFSLKYQQGMDHLPTHSDLTMIQP